MVPKPQKKSKAPQKRDGPHHRAAQKENKQGFACPVCFAVPPTIRNDGISTARHLPASSGHAKFRGSEFCNGQGQVGRHVLDKNWKPGREPEHSITAKEFLAHGVKRYEERLARKAEKAERKSRPAKAKREPKPTKAAKPKPKAKPAKRKAKPAAAQEPQSEPEEAPAEEPQAEQPAVEEQAPEA